VPTRPSRSTRSTPAPGTGLASRATPTAPSVAGSAPAAGRSLVSRRALTDLIRSATLTSYGITGFAGARWWDRIGDRLGLPPRGIHVGLAPELTIELDLTVAHGLPIAEVARQVDSAVRYTIRRALDREVGRLTIHVQGLRAGPLEALPGAPGTEPRSARASGPATDDLAASGTDVA
jgi:uncharacterized alkaline shock family protein YloU